MEAFQDLDFIAMITGLNAAGWNSLSSHAEMMKMALTDNDQDDGQIGA
jgi:hypothetical protein